jgi:hypothetical protein
MMSILTCLFNPNIYWKTIDERKPSWRWTTFRLLLPAAIVITISNLTSILLFGGYKNYSTLVSLSFVIVTDFCAFALLNFYTAIARLVSKSAGGTEKFATVYSLVCFSGIPLAVFSVIAPLLKSIPMWITVFPALFGLYSLVLLYVGVNRLLAIHKRKALVSILIVILPFLLVALSLLIVDLLLFFLVDIVF